MFGLVLPCTEKYIFYFAFVAFFFTIGGDSFELPFYITGGLTIIAGLILLPAVYKIKQSAESTLIAN